MSIGLWLAACSMEPPVSSSMPRPTTQGPQVDMSSWLEYRNEEHRFLLRYPPEYVILEPRSVPAPTSIFRVWFQEPALAQPPIAEHEVPRFAVDIHRNPSGLALDDWLAEHRNLGRYSREPVRVGDVEGIRVTDRAALAPGVFYYVARKDLVYVFTPFGPQGDSMLQSVRFLP